MLRSRSTRNKLAQALIMAGELLRRQYDEEARRILWEVRDILRALVFAPPRKRRTKDDPS